MLKLSVMCSKKANSLGPDVVICEQMKEAVQVDVVDAIDCCDVIQMLAANAAH